MLLDVRFRINFNFGSFGFGRPQMSRRSEMLAGYARRAKANQPQQNEVAILRNRLLDDGFQRLREDLKTAFEQQIDEFHKEPDCADTLKLESMGENGFSVQKRDDAESKIDVKCDAGKRSVAISCKRPTKFTHFIEVMLNSNETGTYLYQGESRKDKDMSVTSDVDWIVSKALLALYGVEG